VSEDLIARIMVDHTALMDYLGAQGEISFLSTMESSLPKVVLLAAASDLEHEIQQIIISYYMEQTNNCEFAISFVHNKAVSRQYHTYFDWKNRSANSFFALFGDRFKVKAREALKADADMAQAVADFCEIGDLRNQLVHENYAAFTMEKTAHEVHAMYVSARKFIAGLPALLQDN
jgi:RiboL-PSP-HEPN